MDRRRFIASLGALGLSGALGAGLNGTAQGATKKPMARRLIYGVNTIEQVTELAANGSQYIWPRDIFQTGMGGREPEYVQSTINLINQLYPRNEVVCMSGTRRLEDMLTKVYGYNYAGFDYEESTLPEGYEWKIDDFDYCLDQVSEWLDRIQHEIDTEWPNGSIMLVPTGSPLHQNDLSWDYGELAMSNDKIGLLIPMTQGLAARGTVGPALTKLANDLALQQYPTLRGGASVKPALVANPERNEVNPSTAGFWCREIWKKGLGVAGLWGGNIPAYVETMKMVRKPR